MSMATAPICRQRSNPNCTMKLKKWGDDTGHRPFIPRNKDQLFSGTMLIAPHGHSDTHKPHPLQ